MKRILDAADFPEQRYRQHFPDVDAAIADGIFESGHHHYLVAGYDEMIRRDRAPLPEWQDASPTGDGDHDFDELGGDFFEDLYLHLNPDVRKAVDAGIVESGAAHWRDYGRAETLERARPSLPYQPGLPVPGPLAAGDTSGAHEYLAGYPDVFFALGGSPVEARQHFLVYGRAEGRRWPGVTGSPKRTFFPDAFARKGLGVRVFGPFGESTGLGTAARAFARVIAAAGLPVAFESFRFSEGRLLVAADRRRGDDVKINLIVATCDQMPLIFSAYPPGTFDSAYNVAIWHWELPALRLDYTTCFDGLDEIWTTSTFQRNAIASISPIPVHRFPIPVAVASGPIQSQRPRFGIPADAFTFYLSFDMGSVFDRKNPLAALHAFRRAFGDGADVFLVIKIHHKQHDLTSFRRLLQEIEGLYNVLIIADSLDLGALRSLYMSVDALLVPSRSEGFGLHVAEFMSLGKAVIATGYSGYMDFFDDEVGFVVQHDLVEVEQSVGPYVKGSVWAEPRIDSLVEQMRLVVADRDLARSRGQAAKRRIEATLGLERVAGEVKRRIDRLELDAPVPHYLQNLRRADDCVRSLLWAQPLPPYAGAGSEPILFSVIIPVFNVPGPYLAHCIESVFRQNYPLWEICICDDASSRADTLAVLERFRGRSLRVKIVTAETNLGIAGATNRAVEMAAGEYIVFLDNDDAMDPSALTQISNNIAAHDADIIYTDERKIDENGNLVDHFFKPDWSPEHLESVMYMLHQTAVRKSLFLSVGGLRSKYDGAQDYDLMLRLSRATKKIQHVPECLYSWRAIPGSAAAVVDAKPWALENGAAALAEHVAAKYGKASAVEPGLLPGTFRVRRPIVGDPVVTLLVLTGNKTATVEGRGEIRFFENFIASINKTTTYANYRIMVVDNSTLTGEQIERLAAEGVAYRNFGPMARFNFAKKANFAIACAESEYVVLLNDDMEVKRGDWLTSMVELLGDSEVGAVGARLLHADDTIQHVGMFLGIHGSVSHPYHNYPGDFVGYNGFTHIIRNFSVVTAACLATRRSVIRGVGGFDEAFAVDFNDVDLCLRLRQTGYRIVYTPFAELYHFESKSLARTAQDPAEVALFLKRWSHALEDPFYNRNLTKSRGDMSLDDAFAVALH